VLFGGPRGFVQGLSWLWHNPCATQRSQAVKAGEIRVRVRAEAMAQRLLNTENPHVPRTSEPHLRIKSGSLIVCGVLGLALSFTQRASALSCVSSGFWAPGHDAVDVPTNTRMWCSSDSVSAESPIILTDSDGAVVSGTHTRVSSPEYGLWVFRPDSELAPRSEYHWSCSSIDYGSRTSSFTTGESATSGPPEVPDLSSRVLHASPDESWGPSYYARFPGAGEPSSIIVLDLAGNSTLDAAGPSGYVADARLPLTDGFFVGSYPCGGNWSEAGLGASTTVALGAFNLAGEFSGWSDTLEITLPTRYTTQDPGSPGGPGCHLGAAGGSSSGAAGLIAAFLWQVVRRARRNTAQ
jgi:hypothetical protein